MVMTISVVTSVKTVDSKKLPPNLYVDGGGALAAGHHLGALVDGVGDVRLDFPADFMSISGPITASARRLAAHLY